MKYLLLIPFLTLLLLIGYFAACAGGDRFLTLREWMGKWK